jgi:hypothetical protein
VARKNPAAVALGKRGGKVKTEAKAAASRANGAKGGRPKKKGRAFGAVCDPAVGVLPAEAPHMRWEGVADVTSFAENNVRVTRCPNDKQQRGIRERHPSATALQEARRRVAWSPCRGRCTTDTDRRLVFECWCDVCLMRALLSQPSSYPVANEGDTCSWCLPADPDLVTAVREIAADMRNAASQSIIGVGLTNAWAEKLESALRRKP